MYLTKNTLNFLADLAANNDRTWFNENKSRYENEAKVPFIKLITKVIDELGEPITFKESIFRINRDTRFSSDKTPYKTHLSAIVSKYGTKDKSYPGLYIHLDSEQFTIGGGAYFLEKTPLQNVRNGIMHHHQEFTSILNDKNFLKYYDGLHEAEVNKVLPSEFKAFQKTEPLIANKQFFVMKDYPSERALESDIVDFIINHAKALNHLNQFLRDNF